MKTGIFFILLNFFALIIVSSDQSESNQSSEIKTSQSIEIETNCVIPTFSANLKTNYSTIFLFKIFHSTNQLDVINNQVPVIQYSQNRIAFLESKPQGLKRKLKFKLLLLVDKDDDHLLS